MAMADEIETEGEEQKTDSDIEARARRMGWKPKGEYDNRGDFMSAEEFIKKGEEDLPILRSRLRKMDDNYNKVFTELADTKKTFEDFRKFMTNSEKRAYDRARKELVEKRDAAVAHADTEVFKETEKEIEELDKNAQAVTEQPRGQAQQTPQTDPVTDQWVKDNPWFLRDLQLNRAAKIVDSDLLESSPGLPPEERLATVKAEVARMYPDKFKNPRRDSPAAVAQPSGEGGARSRTPNGKSYDDLPPEAKKACDKFVKTIKGYTRDEYLKNYDWS